MYGSQPQGGSPLLHEQFDNAYEREPDDATIVTSYPLVTISSILPSLDNLPAELIQEIARNSDDETIWRMRGVCHHVRNSVEAELNLRLVNQVLVCDPPFSGHISEHANDIDAYDPNYMHRFLSERGAALKRQNELLDSRLDTYPPTRSLLRKFTLEVHDDDPWKWGHLISRFAPQLQELVVHVIIPPSWLPSPDDTDENTDARSIRHETHRGWYISPAIWPLSTKVLSFAYCKNLTVLTLSSISTRALYYFHFAKFAPNLVDLRLHFPDRGDRFWSIDAAEAAAPISLRKLTIFDNFSDHFPLVAESMSAIQSLIRYSGGLAASAILRHTGAIDNLFGLTWDCKNIEHIALYGFMSYSFSGLTYAHDHNHLHTGRTCPNMTNIKILVLERQKCHSEILRLITREEGFHEAHRHDGRLRVQRRKFLEREGEGRDEVITAGYVDVWTQGTEGEYSSKSQILHDDPLRRPNLPMLEQLTWVDTRLDSQGHIQGSPSPLPAVLYEESVLLGLFERYPTLKQVQWVNAYSTHPFDEDPQAKQDVVCRIMRPTEDWAADDTPLRPIWPGTAGTRRSE